MIEQFFMPFDQQFDDGFQATGDAFKDAAEKLVASFEGKITFPNGHLPINFLYRHSVELFLKSAIITIHRALKLPTRDGGHTRDPLARIGEQWKPLTKIHSLKVLLTEMERLITSNQERFKERDASSWLVPSELCEWIDTIEAHDSGSTFSRYPRTDSVADPIKPGFVRVDLDAFIADMHAKEPGKPGRVLMAIKNSDNLIVDAFGLQEDPLPDFPGALVKASEMMSATAFGLHAELVDGMGRKIKEWRAEHDAKED